MINKIECYWCFKKYTKKKKATRQRFCSRKCLLSQWRAKNIEKLRKYSAEYKKKNIEKILSSKRKWNDKNRDYRKLYYLANQENINRTISIGYRKQLHSRIQAKRIVKRFGIEKKCFIGKYCDGRIELHHKDGNALNNKISNLIYLCRHHHMNAHIKMNHAKRNNK